MASYLERIVASGAMTSPRSRPPVAMAAPSPSFARPAPDAAREAIEPDRDPVDRALEQEEDLPLPEAPVAEPDAPGEPGVRARPAQPPRSEAPEDAPGPAVIRAPRGLRPGATAEPSPAAGLTIGALGPEAPEPATALPGAPPPRGTARGQSPPVSPPPTAAPLAAAQDLAAPLARPRVAADAGAPRRLAAPGAREAAAETPPEREDAPAGEPRARAIATAWIGPPAPAPEAPAVPSPRPPHVTIGRIDVEVQNEPAAVAPRPARRRAGGRGDDARLASRFLLKP